MKTADMVVLSHFDSLMNSKELEISKQSHLHFFP